MLCGWLCRWPCARSSVPVAQSSDSLRPMSTQPELLEWIYSSDRSQFVRFLLYLMMTWPSECSRFLGINKPYSCKSWVGRSQRECGHSGVSLAQEIMNEGPQWAVIHGVWSRLMMIILHCLMYNYLPAEIFLQSFLLELKWERESKMSHPSQYVNLWEQNAYWLAFAKKLSRPRSFLVIEKPVKVIELWEVRAVIFK